jgi:hypothetical protein
MSATTAPKFPRFTNTPDKSTALTRLALLRELIDSMPDDAEIVSFECRQVCLDESPKVHFLSDEFMRLFGDLDHKPTPYAAGYKRSVVVRGVEVYALFD